MKYNNIHTIRYMGNKKKLLEHIIPEIVKVTPTDGTVCDIMAGSNAVSYALKDKFKIITNDVQYYSYIISSAIIENQSEVINKNSALKYLKGNYNDNLKNMEYNFFYENYTDTYFSGRQCKDIDSIRYAISKCDNLYIKHLYLTALMGAMCTVQSTPGHFAQFMPKDHYRIIKLRDMNLWDEFLKKTNDYSNLVFTKFDNKSYCADYKDLLKKDLLNEVSTIYLDSPYNQEQYSRFYHILETISKYDNPDLNFKARYRDDRFKSGFSYKSKVKDEFETILEYSSKNRINLVISYTEKGTLDKNELIKICHNYFPNVEIKKINYQHSSQGKGTLNRKEYIITNSY